MRLDFYNFLCRATWKKWVSNVRSLSILIPSNLAVLVILTFSLQIYELPFVLGLLKLMTRDFPRVSYHFILSQSLIQLFAPKCQSVAVNFYRFWNGVIVSKVVKLRFFKWKNSLLRNLLNRIGPKIDPCCARKSIACKVLQMLLVFTFCLLSVK